MAHLELHQSDALERACERIWSDIRRLISRIAEIKRAPKSPLEEAELDRLNGELEFLRRRSARYREELRRDANRKSAGRRKDSNV